MSRQPDFRNKIMSRQAMAEQCNKWRAGNQSIVFTNGCFDLLHPGHIHLLTKASALGDKLIVAINSDNSVRRLKGNSRPLQSQAARADVLASLAVVDAVVVFEEDTPFEILQQLLPDVLVKGGDYKADEIVGADLLKSTGGKVVIIQTLPGHSTTGLEQQAGKPDSE